MEINAGKEIIEFLRPVLNLTSSARIEKGPYTTGETEYFSPDYVINDLSKVYFIIIRRKLNLTDLARIHLLRSTDNLNGFFADTQGTPIHNADIVGLTVLSSQEVESYASSLKVRIFRIPMGLYQFKENRSTRSVVKLTTQTSFSVIFSLLKAGRSTIFDLAKKAEVSYGWTHNVVSRLIDIGTVEKHAGLISITNINRLFDSLAYERPIGSLLYKEVFTDNKDSLEMAHEISEVSRRMRVKLSFTSYTYSSLVERFNIRHDVAYVYLNKNDYNLLSQAIGFLPKGNVKLNVYLPDRDVFKDCSEVSGITVVSEKQALLDLASGGIPTRDLTLRMAERLVRE